MQEWIRHTLSPDQLGLAALPAAFLLGMLGSVSSCCTLPVLGAVAGYAGGLAERRDGRQVFVTGAFFCLGTVVSLAALGAAAGFVGQAAGASLAVYWRFAAGVALVAFGLVAVGLLRLRVPSVKIAPREGGRGVGGALVYGLALGGGTTACSFACNPLLPLAMGAAMLKGATLLGAAMLACFALGYSLPLGAGLVGLGLGAGRLARVGARALPVVRVAGGLLLIVVGFYILIGA